MSQFVNALSAGIVGVTLVVGAASVSRPAAAAPMSDADKAAMKKANDSCKAQVKEEAHFHEMSWWARHKAVKKCVNDMLAGH
jgi:stress-induced morphogen